MIAGQVVPVFAEAGEDMGKLRLTALAVALGVVGGVRTETRAQHARKTPVVEAVAKTRSSIVTISIPRSGKKDAVGSGIIVDERGYIVTNRHVIGGAQTVYVRLADKSTLTGHVVAVDPEHELAILRVRAGKSLSALPLAPAGDLMVGERVIAVGHPFGYVNTVSTGIVSALDREITLPTGAILKHLIQTDASINPGNSGGPLLNINGELIGINVALREGAQGIAFAINADMVKRVLSRQLSALKVSGIYHGFFCVERILAESGPRQRVVVTWVEEESPAADAGLEEGDEILTVANRAVANRFDVERAFWDKHPGQRVALQVLRESHSLTLTLTLVPAAEGNGIASAVRLSPCTDLSPDP
jgi:serine protease Do